MQANFAGVPTCQRSFLTRALTESTTEDECQVRLEEGQRPDDRLNLGQLVQMAAAFGITASEIDILRNLV